MASTHLQNLIRISAKIDDKETFELKWANEKLAINPGINWNFTKEFPELFAKSDLILANSNVSLDILRTIYRGWFDCGSVEETNYNARTFDAHIVSHNPNINFEFLEKYLWYDDVIDRTNWDRRALSENPALTWKDAVEYGHTMYVDAYSLSYFPDLTLEDIIDYGYPKSNLQEFGQHKNLTYDMVLAHPEYNGNWNYWYISQNPNITWDIVKNNLDKPWNYKWLLQHANFTYDIIVQNEIGNFLDASKRYKHISRNPNITLDIVKNNLDKPWNWEMISAHFNITLDIIENNIELDWNIKGLSRNPNLTWMFVVNTWNEDWDWEAICENKFNHHIELKKRATGEMLIRILSLRNKKRIYDSAMCEFRMIISDKSRGVSYKDSKFAKFLKNMFN